MLYIYIYVYVYIYICYVNSLKVLIPYIPITLHAEFLFLTRLRIFLSPKVLNQSIHQLLTMEMGNQKSPKQSPNGVKMGQLGHVGDQINLGTKIWLKGCFLKFWAWKENSSDVNEKDLFGSEVDWLWPNFAACDRCLHVCFGNLSPAWVCFSSRTSAYSFCFGSISVWVVQQILKMHSSGVLWFAKNSGHPGNFL